MKRLPILLLTLLFAGCVSADQSDPSPQRAHGGYYADAGARPMRADDAAATTFMPPFNWWHNDNVANAISLTADQVRSLDAALSGDAAEVATLETRLRDASADFRKALETDPVAADQVTGAAQRVRDARGALFDRQVQLLIAERKIVTAQQWTDLEQFMQRSRRGGEGERGGRRGNRGGYGGSYPGGMPGGGPPNPWGW